ncbi:carboxypeptidase-like regulatory domain-containing protein [Hymenobacter bucti]|uniref:Carboxypeptidase-like regulatory domain-containing protein n=1 Tax=Hymenobacter bucti TaxID=1844114 RepID=A0ABW4R2P0_9BACT
MSYLNAFSPLLAVVFSLGTARAQPTKTLTGRLLDDRLEGVPGATIYVRDTTFIGTTDRAGYFQTDVPVNTNTLLFTAVGLERTTVTLSADCSHLEVILLLASSYDFMSVRRVNRQELKRFKHLPQLHQQAYEQGLFTSRVPCASPIFTKWVPRTAKR